jgi:hypothetical protein
VFHVCFSLCSRCCPLLTQTACGLRQNRAAVEHYMKISKAERRRYEKLMSGGSLGRSFSRSYAGGLQDHHHHHDGASMAEPAGVAADLGADKDRSRRASLRVSIASLYPLASPPRPLKNPNAHHVLLS